MSETVVSPDPPSTWAKMVKSAQFSQFEDLRPKQGPRVVRTPKQDADFKTNSQKAFEERLVEVSMIRVREMFPTVEGELWYMFSESSESPSLSLSEILPTIDDVANVGFYENLEVWHAYNPSKNAIVEFVFDRSQHHYVRFKPGKAYKQIFVDSLVMDGYTVVLSA